MTDLNQEALEKAQEAVKHMGTRVCTVEAAIRTYLASLPPADVEPVASDLVERLRSPVFGTQTALQAAAAIIALQGEVQELNRLLADGANGRTLAAEEKLKRCTFDNVDLQVRLGEALSEIARLKDELAEGCDLLDRFDGHLPTVRRYLERARSFRDGQKTGEKG